MNNINEFEISKIDKEVIKMRIFFIVSYYGDKVLIREEYVNEVFQNYDEELNKNEIIDKNNCAWGLALLTLQIFEIQYRVTLTFISLIRQMFEQFLTEILIEKLDLKKGLYFSEVKDKFKQYGFEFEKVDSWKKIYELGLLVNVIKHGDGDSRKKLQVIRKDYFFVNNSDDMLKSTINNMKLNVTEKDFIMYCEKIIEFINDMPSNYKKI